MKHIGRPSGIDIALLLAVAIVWGTAFPAIKLVVDDLGALWAAAARVSIGFLAVAPFFVFQPQFPRSSKVWLAIATVAMLNMVIPFIMISWSMHHINAGVGALLLGMTPFIAMVMGHFLTRDERINRYRILAVIFAVSGVAVLAGTEAISGLSSAALFAQLAVILAGVCYVSAGFVMRRLDMAAIPFTVIALGIGSATLVGLALITEGLPQRLPEGGDLVALFWLGVAPTGLAYLMRYFLVQRVGVSTFALAMNTVPVFGIIIAAIWLGEMITSTTLIALLLVLNLPSCIFKGVFHFLL